MSTGAKVLVGVVCAVTVLVMVGVLAVIAVPVFLNQRAKATAAATTLALGRCGQLAAGGGIHCVFADAAGAVGVMVRGTGAAAEREALSIREQVEQRRT